MPLTKHQAAIARLLAPNRSPDSHLAGGAALHISPRSIRFSNDLDYFHDSVERVAQAFEKDCARLEAAGYAVHTEIRREGYVRAIVSRKESATKIEWAHDSDWRFLPVQKDRVAGYRLSTIDIAVNKLLALAGRDEPRDFVDILHIHRNILPLGALCWAAAGKDPGFTPLSLLDLLRRRGKHRPEDFQRLLLEKPFDLQKAKAEWLATLENAERFIRSRPPAEVGCLYYSRAEKVFIAPKGPSSRGVVKHLGKRGGAAV